jgi:hypothetical protein
MLIGFATMVPHPFSRALVVSLAVGVVLVVSLTGQGGGNPTGFTAQVAGTTVTFSWAAPAAPPAPVVGYALQAGPTPGATIVSLPVGDALTFSVTAPFGVYYVRVVALAASGPIGVSADIQVVVQPPGVPNPPLALSATVSGTSVGLVWQASSTGAAPTFYQLQAGTAPGLSNLATLNLSASTLTLNTTAPPGTYYVRVAAGNAAGISFPSNEVTVTTAAVCTPTTPFPPSITVAPGTLSLRWFPRTGPAATSYRLMAGTASGASDLGVFDFPATQTTVASPAPSRRYFIRLQALNACGASAPSNEVSFVVPPTNLPSLIGTWVGTITNHVPRPSGRLITSFTLQLNANPPFAGSTFGRFTSTFCNHVVLAGYYSTSTGSPAVSMESMSCTDGDFGLSMDTITATRVEGQCVLGGPNCRFTMTRQ